MCCCCCCCCCRCRCCCPRIAAIPMSFVSIIFHYEIKLGSRRATSRRSECSGSVEMNIMPHRSAGPPMPRSPLPSASSLPYPPLCVMCELNCVRRHSLITDVPYFAQRPETGGLHRIQTHTYTRIYGLIYIWSAIAVVLHTVDII